MSAMGRFQPRHCTTSASDLPRYERLHSALSHLPLPGAHFGPRRATFISPKSTKHSESWLTEMGMLVGHRERRAATVQTVVRPRRETGSGANA